MKIEKKIFQKFLGEKDLWDTPQRELILDTFLQREGHISAEELYDIVKKRDSSIGQATVYRMLKLLTEAKLAREVDFGDNVKRYEQDYNHPHHDHFVCRGCGKTVEVVNSLIEELQQKIAKQYGFELTDHAMYLYGFCEDCRKKNSKKQ